MSSSKKETAKQKKSIGSGIFAIVKRKKKSKLSRSSQDLSSKSNSSFEATGMSETEILRETGDFLDMELVEDLKSQLQAAQNDLEVAGCKIKEDEEVITTLQIQLQNVQGELENTQDKLSKVEEGTEGVSLDDNSFHEAEMFKLKQQIEDLQKEIDKKSDLDKQVNHLTDEVADLQTQNQELRFQEERSNTRSKMKSITEEKNTKEEIQRLQKELRMAERNMKFETSSFEAQLKAAQDGIDRLQDKARVAQTRFDEIDKERLELKIENKRLQKKLEKTGSYAEKKRLQTEQETVELELKNMKRKNVKLEQQLVSASNQMLNIVGFGGSDHNSENGTSLSGTASPIPRLSLSESKMINLEKEVAQLEAAVTKLRKENKSLEEKAESSGQTSEAFSLKVKHLDNQLTTERSKVEEMETELNRLTKVAAGSSGEDYLASIHKQIDSLNQSSKDLETKFRVKEKDLWSTIEAQKKQIEELEMDKLALELGEVEEGEETEERDYSPKPEAGSSERISELQQEIESLKETNEKLKKDLQAALKKLQEASEREGSWLTEKQEKETEANAKHTEELEKLKSNNEQLQGALEESVAKSEKLQSDFVSFEEESMALKSQNENLTKELEEAKSTSKQVPSLRSEIEKLKQEVVELESSVAASESDKASSDAVSLLEKEVERLNKINSQIMKDLEDAEEELDHREDRIEETKKLQVEIEKLQKENKRLRTDFDSAEEELEKLDTELIEQARIMTEEIKNLKKENAEIRAGKKESSPRLRDARESTPRPRETTPPKKAVKLKEAPAPAAKKGPKAPPKKVKSPATTPQFSVPAVSIKTKKVIVTGGVKLPGPHPQVKSTKEVEPEDKTETQEPEAEPKVETESKQEVEGEVENSNPEADNTPQPEAEDQSQKAVSDIADMEETQPAPSLTPKFKKPPPAPKKKPSRESLRKKAENLD